jgi:DNA-binding transcriptional ArsR family regulator
VIRLRLSSADLGRVRFVTRPHPVGAAALASQVLRGAHAPGPLRHLLPARGLLPDFVTPYQGLDSVEAGLDAIRSTPRRRVRADVARAYAHLPATPWRRRLADGDREAVELLASALGGWFDAELRPQWGDVTLAHRRWVDRAAHQWALSGVDGVLNGLHPAVRWRAPVLEVDTWWSADLAGSGEGLLLTPSPFAGPRPRLLVERGRPALLVFPVTPPAGGVDAAQVGDAGLAERGSPPAEPGRTRPVAPPAAAGGDALAPLRERTKPAAAGSSDAQAPLHGRTRPAAATGAHALAPLHERTKPAAAGSGDALAALVGRTRAAVLRRLGEPGRHTTTALARATGISLPSASEHAAALRAAGLIASEREGGAVVHRLTPLGVELLGAAG